MGGRVVLHSDLNNCYASIECMLHPELRGKYIAVCGLYLINISEPTRRTPISYAVFCLKKKKKNFVKRLNNQTTRMQL